MYHSFKRIAKQIVPKQFLLKNEFFFRKLISLKYKGNKHQCTICKIKLSRFVILNDKDELCPSCGSRSRTRRLYNLLNESNALNGNVLHFSPPRALYEKFKKLDGVTYYSSDFENEFVADYNYDITAIDAESNFFDLIICYHILEHIEKDTKAMSELFRVLKPNGICFIQTPFKEGIIYEDAKLTSPEERKLAFGQEDHVRVYSVEGLRNRLEFVGFSLDIKSYESNPYLGFKDETIIIAKKPN